MEGKRMRDRTKQSTVTLPTDNLYDGVGVSVEEIIVLSCHLVLYHAYRHTSQPQTKKIQITKDFVCLQWSDAIVLLLWKVHKYLQKCFIAFYIIKYIIQLTLWLFLQIYTTCKIKQSKLLTFCIMAAISNQSSHNPKTTIAPSPLLLHFFRAFLAFLGGCSSCFWADLTFSVTRLKRDL